jgi:hypothetical protein
MLNQANNNKRRNTLRTNGKPKFIVFNIVSKYYPKVPGKLSAWRNARNNEGLLNRFQNLSNREKELVIQNVNNLIRKNHVNLKKQSNFMLNARHRVGLLKKPTTARPSTKRR